MQKVGKKKRRIGAVILSLVMALSMIFTPSAFTQKKVSASTPIDEMTQLQKWSLISRLLDEKDRYFENKPTDKAAAIYTAAEYYWEQGEGSVDVYDFCSSVGDHFAGIENFDESRLEKIGDNDFFKYDSDTEEVEIKALSQGPTAECTYIGSTDEDANTEYGIWTDPDPEENLKPYYVALDTDEDQKIVSYRQLPADAVNFTFDIYKEDEYAGEYISSYITSSNKVFIPSGNKASVQYYITIKDGEDKMPVQFTSNDNLEENIFNLSISSGNKKIVHADEDNTLFTEDDKTGTTNLTYEIKSVESGNVIYTDTLPCTTYKLSINGCNPGWWLNILPKENMTLKVNMEGYTGKDVTFVWNSDKYNLNNVEGQTCKITAPKSTGEGKISITPCINGEPLASYDQEVDTANCKLGIATRDMNTFKNVSGALKVGTSYMLMLDGADWGWDYNNGSKSFYTIKFTQDKKSVTVTDEEKNLKADFANIGIGAGGGNPNRVLTPKKAGKLTVTGSIYRNGAKKPFRTVTKTFTIQDKVTVSKTTLSSVKNLKGKKMQIKWKKNTAGQGYQIQYSTSSKFAKGNKTATISKNKTTSYTASKLTKNKTYYVRIRTYKKVSGKTYYSGWSSVKKVKITK